MKFPPPLRPGDTIAVVAPSSPFDVDLARSGIAWLRRRYHVVHRPTLFARTGFLAGSDTRRLTELQRALDSDASAIIAARGGYGLARVAPLLDWTRAIAKPKWLVGFSDFSIAHAEAWRRGIATVHGTMVCSLGKATKTTQDQWIDVLENPRAARAWQKLATWRRGSAEGTLVGGNLAMLHSAAAAARLRIPRGAIVLLEDIGERPYRVDRMLTDLMSAAHFRHAAAIIVGDFTDCNAGPDGTSVDDVLRERLGTLGIPIVARFPAGHGDRNDAVVLGRRTHVECGARTAVVRQT